MKDFSLNIAMRRDEQAKKVRPWKVLNSAQREALALIRKQFPQGCAVLDIGCGTGYFLRALRELHYQAYGLDVAQPVAELLRGEGFPVWHGTVDTVPPGWVEPQVCTSFMMLHHVPDPVGFIGSVRSRFPRALFILVEANSLDNRRPPPGFAQAALPRSYTWWGKRQLQLAMEKGQYNPAVVPVLPQPREGGMPQSRRGYAALRRYSPFLARQLLAFYYHLLPALGIPGALWMRWHKHYKYILAVGHPMGEG